MGWFWFVPTFHMPPPPNGGSSTPPEPVKLTLTRKEIDFPLGIGSMLVDVEIPLEWIPSSEAVVEQVPARQTSDEALVEGDKEPAGFSATVQGVAAGELGEAMKASQASGD